MPSTHQNFHRTLAQILAWKQPEVLAALLDGRTPPRTPRTRANVRASERDQRRPVKGELRKALSS